MENLENEKNKYENNKILLSVIEITLKKNLETNNKNIQIENNDLLINVIKELIKNLENEIKLNTIKEIENRINNENLLFKDYYKYCIKNDNKLNLEYFMNL